MSETVMKRKKKFVVGDLAVYPAYGVGKIESIEGREIDGKTTNFYIIKLLENSMVIMIPTSNIDVVGLRNIIDKNEVPKIYSLIKAPKNIIFDNQTWNRRYKDYMDKIKTGSLYNVAEVYRDLFLLKMKKDLSFGERKLLDTAQKLLIKELCATMQKDEETMQKEIENLFPKIKIAPDEEVQKTKAKKKGRKKISL